MNQSKSYLSVIAICLALFAIGLYLKLSHKSEKIKNERATEAAAEASAKAATPAPPKSEPQPKPTEAPIPTPPFATTPTPAPSATPVALDSNAQAQAAANESVSQHTQLPQFNDRQAFKKILLDAKASIPSLAHLRDLSQADLHETPVEIQNAGIAMGRVSEALEKHPEMAPDAIAFYEECAVNDQYPISVRSSCYLDLWRLYKKQGREIESFSGDRKVSEQVKRNAKSLMH